MTTVFISWFALHALGAIAFVVLAKKSSVLVDDEERPIIIPDGAPNEHVQLVRRIGAAS
ncbi:MAG TPA: hypothetical protein V6D05_11465 [Stenomitos sp.]